MAEWYCTIGGEKHGPLSQQLLEAWITQGRLRRSDLVWRQGMPDWVPAGEVSEFSRALVAAAARQPRRRSQGLSSGAIIAIVLAPLAFLGALVVLPAIARERERSRFIRCRNNLNQLAKGMATYLNECGDNRFYPWPSNRPGCGTRADPQFGGAEWLATLYWTRIIPDPGVYNCPSTSDSNEQGVELGSLGCPRGAPLSRDAVSYAAMGSRSVGVYMESKQNKPGYASSRLAIRDDFPPNEPMGSDDTDEPINHGGRDSGGMAVLFFDSHIEYWTYTRVDLETGVGAGDLCALKN
ncbi:MAG: DUF4339 domain-containing protein [Planctomycetes bacterium]|nr:DUF4339 domain-containing protein [Planctomycetota bacterium]